MHLFFLTRRLSVVILNVVFYIVSVISMCLDNRQTAGFDIKLTKAMAKYTVVEIMSRDGGMILKEFSYCSSFPDIRVYATSCRITHC